MLFSYTSMFSYFLPFQFENKHCAILLPWKLFLSNESRSFCARLFLFRFINRNTVLSGAEERGVDGPSLVRSYFSRLQPISFLFFDPSTSHTGNLVARARNTRYRCCTRMQRMPGLGSGSTRRRARGVVSKSAMPLMKSSSQQTLFACSETQWAIFT